MLSDVSPPDALLFGTFLMIFSTVTVTGCKERITFNFHYTEMIFKFFDYSSKFFILYVFILFIKRPLKCI